MASEMVEMPPSKNLFSPQRRERQGGAGPSAWSVVAFSVPSLRGCHCADDSYKKENTYLPYECSPGWEAPLEPSPLRRSKGTPWSPPPPPRTAPWAASNSEALKNVFGEDDVGAQALALF